MESDFRDMDAYLIPGLEYMANASRPYISLGPHGEHST